MSNDSSRLPHLSSRGACLFFYFFFGPSTPTLLHAAVALGPRRTGYPSHCALESRKKCKAVAAPLSSGKSGKVDMDWCGKIPKSNSSGLITGRQVATFGKCTPFGHGETMARCVTQSNLQLQHKRQHSFLLREGHMTLLEWISMPICFLT